MLKRLSIAEERASTLKREFDAAQNELDEARKRVAAHGELEEAARIDEERRIDKKLQCAVTPINQLVRNAWKWIESERPGAFHCYNRACTQMTASGYFRCRFDHDVTFCEVCIDHGKLLDLAGMAREWRPNLMDYWCKQSCLPSYQCELHDDQVGRAAAYNEWLMWDNDKEDCTDKPYCAMSCLGLSAEPTHGHSEKLFLLKGTPNVALCAQHFLSREDAHTMRRLLSWIAWGTAVGLPDEDAWVTVLRAKSMHFCGGCKNCRTEQQQDFVENWGGAVRAHNNKWEWLCAKCYVAYRQPRCEQCDKIFPGDGQGTLKMVANVLHYTCKTCSGDEQ